MPVKKLCYDFKSFIQEYKVITLVIAFIMGQTTNDLVRSFVNNMFMPFINPLIKNSDWESAKAIILGIELNWGLFVASLINFIIISLVIFLIVKKIIKIENTKK